MNWLIFLFASGLVVFPAVVMVILGPGWVLFPKYKRLCYLSCCVGLLLLTVTASWPWEIFAVYAGVTIAWMCFDGRWRWGEGRLRGVAFVSWFFILLHESAYQAPTSVRVAAEPVVIFGDSVTAGTDEPQTITWPKLLAKTHGLKIDDRSEMGAGVSTAVEKAESKPVPKGVVLIEIGGNDVLGGTSVEEFEDDLSTLLEHLNEPGRTLVMFELPVPPAYNRFGMIQRNLAREHKVKLIPKWQFARILTAPNATEDGIHLTQLGQQMFADLVWSVIGDAVQEARREAEAIE